MEDATVCYEAGADAIVVSNHGGRVLDHASSTVDVLEDIAKAFKGKMTILADGGVRTGADVFKYLALGADGVLIGRPFVTYSFGGGTEGVEFFVKKVRSELESVMLLAGAASIKDISTDMIDY